MYVCMCVYIYIYYITLWFHVISWDFQVSHSSLSGCTETHLPSSTNFLVLGIGINQKMVSPSPKLPNSLPNPQLKIVIV